MLRRQLWEPLVTPFDRTSLRRRAFLQSGLAVCAAPWFGSMAYGRTLRRGKFSADPFALGVASGEPTETGVLLWTRLAPKPLEEGGGMPQENFEVVWSVADDQAITKIVRQGTVVAKPEFGHAVHVEVEGLEPGRWYWYQFRVGLDASRVGRTRTAPSAEQRPEALNFAFASCQHYEQGLFTAYQHMIQEPLDLVVHLGDYIYEYGGKEKFVRKHLGKEVKTLDEYRARHAQYRTDPHLQSAHAVFPWLATWDDHEFDNNCAGAVPEVSDDNKGITTEAYLARRAAAYRAYYEHMPLRPSAMPQGPDMTLYRRVNFGGLADFFVLDTRQYRSDQPCGDGNKPPCAASLSPEQTMLGAKQREWLFSELDKPAARWNILAQQVMMARVDRAAGEKTAYSMDQWPGCQHEANLVLQRIADRKVSNPLVLTGDIHCNWANELVADPARPEGPVVATEFVGTSISSGGDGGQTRPDTAEMLKENPFVKFFNNERGYVTCSLTPKLCTTSYKTVPFVTKPDAPLNVRAVFVVEDGRPGLQSG